MSAEDEIYEAIESAVSEGLSPAQIISMVSAAHMETLRENTATAAGFWSDARRASKWQTQG